MARPLKTASPQTIKTGAGINLSDTAIQGQGAEADSITKGPETTTAALLDAFLRLYEARIVAAETSLRALKEDIDSLEQRMESKTLDRWEVAKVVGYILAGIVLLGGAITAVVLWLLDKHVA
jgi:hypothetical protein